MRIKLFRAATVALAMAEIRDVLGLDALILDTVRIEGGVEITAALETIEDDSTSFSPLPDVISFDYQPSSAPALLQPDRSWARHNLSTEIERALVQAPARDVCARLFRFAPLPLLPSAAPMMLVGPPGSGKTLTVAKLAARLVLDGQTPLVITADDRRAGAVEQLASFTRLLGLTLIAAGRPETLTRAMSRRENGAPVIIDTPGLDLDEPAHRALVAELRDAAAAQPVLVLPAGIDPVEAADTARSHAANNVRHLLATRLDRRGRLGGLLAAARAADLALTEAGIGSAVANGLEPMSADMLARRLCTDQSASEHQKRGGFADDRAPRKQPPSSTVLAAHIAAQADASRTASWKTPS